jgi:transcriptional regulator with XRE-family HTH domain
MTETAGDGTQEDADSADEVGYRRAVGKRIRVWRVLHDLSQDDLARSAGVTRNFVSAIERGAQGLDAVRLRRLALAMGMSLGDLLADPEGAPTGER